jgi:hypothetical protein
LTDGGYQKTFIGKGRNKTEAEANVLNTCGKVVNASFCNSGVLTCSAGVAEPGINGYICVIKDSGYGKVFRGEAKNKIEAEALAKQSCQSTVSASFCAVKANCEVF